MVRRLSGLSDEIFGSKGLGVGVGVTEGVKVGLVGRGVGESVGVRVGGRTVSVTVGEIVGVDGPAMMSLSPTRTMGLFPNLFIVFKSFMVIP